MRAYKFLSKQHGIKALVESRVKISRLDELNDPFELLPFDVRNKGVRAALKMTRLKLARRIGVLCFSATWREPVLWAHYSDRHRGICLGFEIPGNPNISRAITYVPNRLPFPDVPTTKDTEAMLFTKYDSWKYEQEIRIVAALDQEVDGVYYSGFGESLALMEVIVGARCSISRAEVMAALGTYPASIDPIKARAGFGRFEMVVDQRGLA
jgi:hypothetical protein